MGVLSYIKGSSQFSVSVIGKGQTMSHPLHQLFIEGTRDLLYKPGKVDVGARFGSSTSTAILPIPSYSCPDQHVTLVYPNTFRGDRETYQVGFKAEYYIEYQPRQSIKVQALTNFLEESTHVKETDLWLI